jgi:hypothetical protein
LDIAADFAELERALVRLREIAALPPERAEARRPEISGWSALEHVAHVALANELIVRNLHGIASGAGLLVRTEGEPVPGALEILESGVIPRGRAQSPRMVRPPARIDRALLAEWMETGAAGFAKHAEQIEVLATATGRIPHQLLGPLKAPQWVRFAAIHTRHHLAIANQVLGG